MKKNRVKLTEGRLRSVVKESVINILREAFQSSELRDTLTNVRDGYLTNKKSYGYNRLGTMVNDDAQAPGYYELEDGDDSTGNAMYSHTFLDKITDDMLMHDGDGSVVCGTREELEHRGFNFGAHNSWYGIGSTEVYDMDGEQRYAICLNGGKYLILNNDEGTKKKVSQLAHNSYNKWRSRSGSNRSSHRKANNSKIGWTDGKFTEYGDKMDTGNSVVKRNAQDFKKYGGDINDIINSNGSNMGKYRQISESQLRRIIRESLMEFDRDDEDWYERSDEGDNVVEIYFYYIPESDSLEYNDTGEFPEEIDNAIDEDRIISGTFELVQQYDTFENDRYGGYADYETKFVDSYVNHITFVSGGNMGKEMYNHIRQKIEDEFNGTEY